MTHIERKDRKGRESITVACSGGKVRWEVCLGCVTVGGNVLGK